jgi:hypothetical protein
VAVKVARFSFLVAGLVGVLFVAPMYFLESRIGRTDPPAITHPEYFYGFVGVTLVWQLFFLVIASDPIRFRPLMLVAVLEKISYGLAAPMLFVLGRARIDTFAAGVVDLGFAVLFTVAHRMTPSSTLSRDR